MKAKLLVPILSVVVCLNINAQTERCATMQNLEDMIAKDPALKAKMDTIEMKTQEWIKNNQNSKYKYLDNKTNDESSLQKINGSKSVTALCSYNNTLYTTIAGPTFINQTVSPSVNCTYAGEYVRVTGLVAGRVYKISTCGVNNFDTEISIYTAGGGQAVAHNDDWCGSQSQILFNPLSSGNYDVLVDAYGCLSNTLCASVSVELVYIPRTVIVIPVVVHVVHYGEAVGVGRNISTAQILSQIDVLNEDFRRLNTNLNTTPAAFRGISDDALIQFCLTTQDEFGNPTSGIKRWLGTLPNYTNPQFETMVKPSTIWDRDKYLNLWTWDGSGAYAQFPGGPANTDGVVSRYDNFGRVGNVVAPFDKGKTAVHEIGHWLNLRHIWGDASGCSTDDLVSDTPLQDVNCPFGTCPAFPYYDACSGSYPGVMFYNQMDYSADACLSMFTYGQTSRMDATLFGSRVNLQSSAGCLLAGIEEVSYNNKYFSIYPNPATNALNIKNINNKPIEAVVVFDITGRKVLEQKENTSQINIQSLEQGMYQLLITSEGKNYSSKFIKE